jgi:hypothetical protein
MCPGDKLTYVNRENYFRCAVMPNGSVRLSKIGPLAGWFVWTQAWFRVDTFDDSQPSLSDKSYDADRTQKPRGVINQKKKCREAEYPEASRSKYDKLKDIPLHPVLSAYCEQQRKNE